MINRARTLAAAATLCAAALLEGCGGGGGSASSTAGGSGGEPVVTAVRTESLKYGLPSTFVVTGSNLDTTVKEALGGAVACSAPSLTRVSASELRVVCTPNDLGVLQVSLVSGGKTLATHTAEVLTPRVMMEIGTGTERRQLELTVNLGAAGGLQRTWANNFLHYVNIGFYQDTILDMLEDMTRIEGGCLTRKAPVGGTPSITDKNIPTTSVFNPEPVLPSSVTEAISNKKYTLAMGPAKCDGTQYSRFSLNLIDNSGGISARDDKKYVAIGSYAGTDPLIQQSLTDLSILARNTSNNKPLREWTADELAPRTIRSMTRIR